MELAPIDTVTAPPPTDGWDWIREHLHQQTDPDAPRWQPWDGQFTAPCPCGRIVTWNAHRGSPQCICARRTWGKR